MPKRILTKKTITYGLLLTAAIIIIHVLDKIRMPKCYQIDVLNESGRTINTYYVSEEFTFNLRSKNGITFYDDNLNLIHLTKNYKVQLVDDKYCRR